MLNPGSLQHSASVPPPTLKPFPAQLPVSVSSNLSDVVPPPAPIISSHIVCLIIQIIKAPTEIAIRRTVALESTLFA